MTLDALSPEDIAARLAAPPAERAAFLRDAAEAGHAEAQAVYAQMLLDGVGVDRDPAAAFGWFRRAAAQHHAMALNMVGRCYDLGWGTRVDKARAAQCFRIAAALGLVEATYNYATALALGAGVAEDRPAALALFERAAAAGYAKAINHVGSFAEDGWVHPRDMAKAADCYARAAEGGDFRGQFNHARMLIARGEIDAALPWLARAGSGGTPAFVEKAAAWLAATGDPRLAGEGVAALRQADAPSTTAKPTRPPSPSAGELRDAPKNTVLHPGEGRGPGGMAVETTRKAFPTGSRPSPGSRCIEAARGFSSDPAEAQDRSGHVFEGLRPLDGGRHNGERLPVRDRAPC